MTDPAFSSPVPNPSIVVNVGAGSAPGSALAPVPSLREGFTGGGFQITKTGNITDKDLSATFVVKVEESIRTALSRARTLLTSKSRDAQRAHDARASYLRSALPTLVPYVRSGSIPNLGEPDYIWNYDSLASFRDAVSLCRRYDADVAPTYSELAFDEKSLRVSGVVSVGGSRSDRSDTTIRSAPSAEFSCSFDLNYRAPASSTLLALHQACLDLNAEIETLNKEMASLRNALGNVDFLERRARAALTEAALAQDPEAAGILQKLSDPNQINAALGYLSGL